MLAQASVVGIQSQRSREFPKIIQESESSETCCKQGDLNSKRLEDLRFLNKIVEMDG